MLTTIIEVAASISAVMGSIYLLMFMASRIIPSMQAGWKGYLGKALLFYGIVAVLTMVSIIFQLPI